MYSILSTEGLSVKNILTDTSSKTEENNVSKFPLKWFFFFPGTCVNPDATTSNRPSWWRRPRDSPTISPTGPGTVPQTIPDGGGRSWEVKLTDSRPDNYSYFQVQLPKRPRAVSQKFHCSSNYQELHCKKICSDQDMLPDGTNKGFNEYTDLIKSKTVYNFKNTSV